MKKVLLISRCLLGEAVRYDGASQPLDPASIAELSARFELLPVCPEAECGLPVPRPPMRLVLDNAGNVRLRRRSDGRDMTAALDKWIASRLTTLPENLAGALLKSKSPSCGSGSTKLYGGDDTLLPETVDGLFAAALRRTRPGLPVADELSFREKLLPD